MDFWVGLSLLIIAIFMILGVEIIVCLGLGAVILTLITESFPLANVGIAAFNSLDVFPLLALPLYILTGDLISAGGISKLLVGFSRSLVGWIRGGLALTTLWAAEGFAAISGSNSATVAAIGRIMVPELKKDGYPIDFVAGTIASCGTVGIITPPSIVFIIYGVTAGVSVGDLFLGGVLPGLLMVISMSLAAFMVCRRRKLGTTTPFSLWTLLRTLWKAKLAFGAIVIILGGIYGGIFTPTEAAAVAVAYCAIAGAFITRELRLKDFPQVMERSAGITGLIAPVIAMATILSENLAVIKLPEAAVSALLSISERPIVVIFLVIVILLIAGCVMETTPNVLLLTPILTPIGKILNYDPVHFGVIVVVTLAIGFITPPIGLNLYVASSITGIPLTRVARHSVPYLIALIFALLIITSFPQLCTFFLHKR